MNVETSTTPAGLLETVLRACRALITVTGDTNELLGFKRVTGSLQALVSEFEKNGWGSS